MKALLWIVFTVAAGAYLVVAVVDPDLWWHITAGRWIIANRDVPVVDYWSRFGRGTEWRAYSWSNEVVFALVDRYFGVQGLLALKYLLAIAMALSFALVISLIAADFTFGALVGALVTVSTFSHFTLRPQSFVWLLFAWVLYLAERIAREGISGRRAAALILVMALWANSHITTALGVGAVFLWVLSAAGAARAAAAAAVAFLGTLITPYLGGEWITFFSKAGHPFAHAAIVEFKPATVLQYSTGFVVLMATLLGAFVAHAPRAFAPARLGLCGIFLLGALAVLKFLPFAMLVMAATAASFWRDAASSGSSLGALGEGIRRLCRMTHALPREGTTFFIGCLVFVWVYGVWDKPLNEKVTPRKAVDFILDQRLPGPYLNTFGMGGYLMYRLSDERGEPRDLVAIDGRTNLIPNEVWVRYIGMLEGQTIWKVLFEQIDPVTVLWNLERPLTSILLQRDEYCMVFRTSTEANAPVVFVKRLYLEQAGKMLPSRNCPSLGPTFE